MPTPETLVTAVLAELRTDSAPALKDAPLVQLLCFVEAVLRRAAQEAAL